MYEIKIEAGNASGTLGQIERGTREMTPLARSISVELSSQVEANFAAEGRPKWLGLKPSTIANRTRRGTWPGMIMQESGQLAASYMPGYDSDSAWIGSNKVYAAIQNFGGDINKAAQSRLVRHRTDTKGNLLRTEHFNGKGLIFAKDSHKRAASRWFEQGAHTIHITARPVLPLDAQSNLQPHAEESILRIASDYLSNLG